MQSEGSFENQQPQEKELELQTMKQRIEHALHDPETRTKIENDFVYTFEQLGLVPDQAQNLCGVVFAALLSDKKLPEIETEMLRLFETTTLRVGDAEVNLIEVLHNKLRNRAELIYSQVAPHLTDVNGKVIDYGAGDGQVTQQLHEDIDLDIEGVDVRPYKAPTVTVNIMLSTSGRVDVADSTYEAALLTNVLHHEKQNEKILNELDRIVVRKLVILETVPVGEIEELMDKDKDRTFMNDYLYNRLFHNADVPAPGTFETPQKWIERFAQHGWRVTHQEDLGYDQPTIKDRHYLLVFER